MNKPYTVLDAIPGEHVWVVGDRLGGIHYHPFDLIEQYPDDYGSAIRADRDEVRLPVLSNLTMTDASGPLTFEAVTQTSDHVQRPRSPHGAPYLLQYRTGTKVHWMEARFVFAPRAKTWVEFPATLKGYPQVEQVRG